MRARVEDRGNTPYSGGADVIPISLVDPGRVELLVLDDTSQPLVVDSDGDGVCDKVNPLLVPTTAPMSSKDALLVNLIPIASTGHADMTGTFDRSTIPRCPARRDRRAAPGSAVLHDGSGHGDPLHVHQAEPAIWTLAPVVQRAPQCVGNQFDAFANNLHDGWSCMAVRAADKLGNHAGLARPARLHRPRRRRQRVPAPVDRGIANATPMTVTTSAPHGLATGDDIVISRPTCHRQWTLARDRDGSEQLLAGWVAEG